MRMTLPILSEQTVRLAAPCATKWDAIAIAGELLVAAGHVDLAYPERMAERERLATTYIGNGVAIPHGTREAMALVRASGISVVRIPAGVDFGDGQLCRLVLGLAAHDDTHLDLLAHIATVCADDAAMERLLHATTARALVSELLPPGHGFVGKDHISADPPKNPR